MHDRYELMVRTTSDESMVRMTVVGGWYAWPRLVINGINVRGSAVWTDRVTVTAVEQQPC